MKKIRQVRLAMMAMALLYCAMLVVYYRYIAGWFGPFIGYGWYDPDPAALVVAFGLAMAPSLYLPIDARKPSDLIFMILYVAMYVPTLIVPHLALDVEPVLLLWYGACTFVGFSVTFAVANGRNIAVRQNGMRNRRYVLLVLAVTLLMLGVMVAGMGLPNSLPTLRDVYDVRSEYKDSLRGVWVGTRYTVMWAQYFLVPLLIGFGLHLSGRSLRTAGALFVALGVLVAVYVFSVSAVKSAVLSLAMIGGVWYALGDGRRFILRLFGGIMVLGVVGLLSSVLLGDQFILLHGLRRFFVVPGLNAGLYYEFFSEHSKLMLSHSIFGGLSPNEYGMGPGNIIGYHHYGRATTNSTAGYLADAYANFGVPGMMVFSLALGLVLNVVDSVSSRMEGKVAITVFAVYAYVLVNTGLLTALLSYGLLLMIAAVSQMPKRLERKNRSVRLRPPKMASV